MIAKALRGLVRFLSSARVATLLLAFVGVWAILASLVPQETASGSEAVIVWGAAHPFAESVVRMLGLHNAFGAPIFLIGVVLLAASTTLCAWRRTKVAAAKGRILRGASTVDRQALTESHDLEVPCDSALSESEILSAASGALGHLGVRTSSNRGVLTSASPSWTVWGSPVFHWALLALIVVLATGSMQRASGQMGLAIGQTKADEPASYGVYSAGPLYGWRAPQRSIRLEAFEQDYVTGGVNRGPTPTVRVLDARGEVIKSQRVYPNHTLKTGSLTVYPSDWGLSATVALTDATGTETGRDSMLVDFSEETTQGTKPVGYLVISDAGNPGLKVFLSVPLDRTETEYLKRLPEELKARVLVTSMDDKTVLDRVLKVGEDVDLPVGGTLRLEDVGYYARIQLVDDASIPFLYATLILATIGLGIATLGRQQIILAAVVDAPDGKRLILRMRLWRNTTTSRAEIEGELARALGRVEEEDTA